jgi:glycosyltransferase involved in cell wall biosynthesis
LTQHEKNVLIKLGFQPEKIKIIPNPLLNSELIKETLRSIKKWEIDEFKKKYGLHGSPIILYLGRIAKTKRLDRLIRCLPYLSKVEKESLLVLAGPDENYLRELMLLTNRLGVSARVKYIGFLNEKEKSLAFLSSNVYVLPSPYEGYGLTLLEAQAHNIPVVAFKGGGQESATFHGILVQDDNPETLATAIIDAIKLKFNCDPEIFSIKTYVDKIEHIYEQLV